MTLTLPGLEFAPESDPIRGNFGQGSQERAIRAAIAEIDEEFPLTGLRRARAESAISIAINIDKGNAKGRAIANEIAALDSIMEKLYPVAEDGPADDSHLTPETRRLLDALAASAQLDAAPEGDAEGL